MNVDIERQSPRLYKISHWVPRDGFPNGKMFMTGLEPIVDFNHVVKRLDLANTPTVIIHAVDGTRPYFGIYNVLMDEYHIVQDYVMQVIPRPYQMDFGVAPYPRIGLYCSNSRVVHMGDRIAISGVR